MTALVTHQPLRTTLWSSRAQTEVLALRWHELVALGIAINEICLQVDTYLMYHLQDASLGAVGGINVSLMTFCLIYLYVVWIARSIVNPPRIRPQFVFNIPMILYIGAVAMSILAAAVKALAFFDVVLLIQAYAIAFYLANRVRTERDLIGCVLLLGFSMVVQSMFVMGLAAFGAAGSSYSFGPIGMGVWEDGRPASTVQSPVVAGSLLALTWVPVMALSLCVRPRWIRWLCIVATTGGMLAILLTQTRGAILTAALATAGIGVLMAKRFWLPKWSIAVALLLVAVGAYPLMRVVSHRVTGGDEGSAVARKFHAEIAKETIRKAPIAGHGAGNCHLACQDVASQSKFRSEWYYTIHCKYLLVWVETGIFGLLAFLLVLGNGIRQGLGAWMSQSNRLLSTLGLGCAAAIAGHMTHMLVDVFNSRCQVHLLWVVLGLTTAIYRMSQDPSVTKAGSVYGPSGVIGSRNYGP